jgi:hypothetical protein
MRNLTIALLGNDMVSPPEPMRGRVVAEDFDAVKVIGDRRAFCWLAVICATLG